MTKPSLTEWYAHLTPAERALAVGEHTSHTFGACVGPGAAGEGDPGCTATAGIHTHSVLCVAQRRGRLGPDGYEVAL